MSSLRGRMRTFYAALICVVLVPAAISPDRTRPPTISTDTVTLKEVRRSGDTLVVERPFDAREGATAGVFVVDEDGVLLRRVAVRYGRGSSPLIEVISGVSAGDRIVVSDMRAWDAFERLQLGLR